MQVLLIPHLLPLLMVMTQINNTSICELSLLTWNCCGIIARLPEIRHLCSIYDIICLQETLITPFHNLNISGFDILRKNIMHSGLRGTAILIRSHIRYSVLNLSNLSHPSIEMQGLAIPLQSGDMLWLINIYRHPACNTPANTFENMFNLFNNNKFTIFLGDFNVHHSL